MLEIWILIFFLFFLFIYNACFLIEGFREGVDPSEDADDPYRHPPIGVTPDREDVPPPPLTPPEDADMLTLCGGEIGASVFGSVSQGS